MKHRIRQLGHAPIARGLRRRRALVAGVLCTLALSAIAHTPPLLPGDDVASIANELSGETAKRNLEGLARFHRQRASEGFHEAVELVAERARAYGLSDVEVLRFPADGKARYGTQRSRRGWNAQEGELSELRDGRAQKLGSYAAEPVVLAEDSESADVTAELVDVGAGTSDGDYAGRTVSGKLVLVSSSPEDVEELAIAKYGAAGIISYQQNQPTAWSGADDSLIRWGHLSSFSAVRTFAFMVSLRTARSLQARLTHGETIRLQAHVRAGQQDGAYEILTATIPGSDPKLKDQEIAYSCHLDHQRPGANDNASGCATILEVARTLATLIREHRLAPPARTIRFIWPPEIEGTVTLLNARADLAQRIRAVIHMDMVGGGPATKAVFHVTRGPMSLPSFIHDVAWSFAAWTNTESYEFAASGRAEYPLTAPEGGREPLAAVYAAYTMGSDHDVYQDSSFGIPAIYLNDWPDRYIHTNGDTAANIDPTKLKRAGFIGAASGYFLANFTLRDAAAVDRAIEGGRLMRAMEAHQRDTPRAIVDAYEGDVRRSVGAFAVGRVAATRGPHPVSGTNAGDRYRRRSDPKGPLVVFGYNYFDDQARRVGVASPKLLEFDGAWGSGHEYAYEALNLADGTRTVRQIADVLSAEYGPIPVELVAGYLDALKRIGVVD